MPQIARTTSGMWAINVSSLQSRITALYNKIQPNKDINAADWNELVNLYNTWRVHRHYSSDLRGKDTYGNIAKYGSGTYVTAYAGYVYGAPYLSANVITNEDITVTKINNLITLINNFRSHKHRIFDTTS